MIVAIDGPVAAGKGTLARRLARHFGFAYLDSGALYRAVALHMLRAGLDPADAAAAIRAAAGIAAYDLADAALRDQAVGAAASKIAAIPEVRAALLGYQRDFAARPPGGATGAVLDGRDIGTVVCPEAEIKIFVTARPEIRARRRFLELAASDKASDKARDKALGGRQGQSFSESEILAEIEARDARDQSRAVAPLRPAPDAYLLDTSDLDIEGAFNKAKDYIQRRL